MKLFQRNDWGWYLYLGPLTIQKYPCGFVIGVMQEDVDHYRPAIRLEWW